jgi:hypothetical protein
MPQVLLINTQLTPSFYAVYMKNEAEEQGRR